MKVSHVTCYDTVSSSLPVLVLTLVHIFSLSMQSF